MSSLSAIKKRPHLVVPITILWLVVVAFFLVLSDRGWTILDYQLTDRINRVAVRAGYGPKKSDSIVYLVVTDSTNQRHGKALLDRSLYARANNILKKMGAQGIIYDMLFTRPFSAASGSSFAASIKSCDMVYLPFGLELTPSPSRFRWPEDPEQTKLMEKYFIKPAERGEGKTYWGKRALLQYDSFASASKSGGYIAAITDSDGIYRHTSGLVKIDDRFIPSFALAVFLDLMEIEEDDLSITPGSHLTLKKSKNNLLENDVVMPMDERGTTYIPYPDVWDKDFPKMSFQRLMTLYGDEDMHGNLEEFFEGKYVVIGDVSTGISDLGHTPLEIDVPLVAVHTALLNGFLTNCFYMQWSGWPLFMVIGFGGLCMGLSFALKTAALRYGVMLAMAAAGILFFIHQLAALVLFPAVSVFLLLALYFVLLQLSFYMLQRKEQAFVRNAFSKYLPESVIAELLKSPESLQLGGEERTVSILFSDIVGFTGISEDMAPKDIARHLNEYLTQMTRIIIEQKGIIDKYEGDLIMAEFGVPVFLKDHTDRAVRAALKMQQCLAELRTAWRKQGHPDFYCRIGINSGEVIAGNMGSKQIFDYTVLGDDVNLASRLEGANKNYDTSIMISEATLNLLAPNCFQTRLFDLIKVKGKTKPVKVYEVIGFAENSLKKQDRDYFDSYEKGFEAYLARQFKMADELFRQCLSLRPEERAASQMIRRINKLEGLELDENWDPSIQLTSK